MPCLDPGNVGTTERLNSSSNENSYSTVHLPVYFTESRVPGLHCHRQLIPVVRKPCKATWLKLLYSRSSYSRWSNTTALLTSALSHSLSMSERRRDMQMTSALQGNITSWPTCQLLPSLPAPRLSNPACLWTNGNKRFQKMPPSSRKSTF